MHACHHSSTSAKAQLVKAVVKAAVVKADVVKADVVTATGRCWKWQTYGWDVKHKMGCSAQDGVVYSIWGL